MYSIFLVDDEYLELKTLHHYINWDSMGFYIAGTAENGRDALTAIAEIRPDVIITDIRMPIMDGISLAQTIHVKFPQILIVFLSGYNEFEYAKSALKVEAAGYLLKPLDMDELAEMMELVREKCDYNLTYRETALSVASEYMAESFFLPESTGWMQNLMTISRMLNGCFGLERENSGYYIGLLLISEYRYLLDNAQNGQILDAIQEEIRSMLKTHKLAWLYRDGRYYIISGNDIHPILSRLCQQGMFRNWITYRQVDGVTFLADFRQTFEALESQEETDPAPLPPQMPLIRDVIALLQQDFAKCLSIDDIASSFRLSPNYLSSLFKESTGQTVLEYLTSVRLEKAADMLTTTAFRIYEISHLVGYENPSYFCMLFQKKFKATPNQYRHKTKR